MSWPDKYYLKQGKLELSMLEGEEELTDAETENDLKISDEVREVDNSDSNSRQELKIDKEIYRTLRAMGKFLTMKEFKPRKAVEPTREKISSSDEIKEISQKVNLRPIPLPFEECLAGLKNAVVLEKNEGKEKDQEISLEQSKIDEMISLYFKSKDKRNIN